MDIQQGVGRKNGVWVMTKNSMASADKNNSLGRVSRIEYLSGVGRNGLEKWLMAKNVCCSCRTIKKKQASKTRMYAYTNNVCILFSNSKH